MTMKMLVASLAIAGATILSASAASAQTIYLKAAGVPGTSDDQDRKDWIEVMSLTDGVSSQSGATGGVARAGRATFADIALMKTIDASTLKLREFATNGKRIPTVEIEYVRQQREQKPQPIYKLTLRDVGVTSSTSSVSSGGGEPVESLSLNYTEIVWSVWTQGAEGKYGWSIQKGAPAQ